MKVVIAILSLLLFSMAAQAQVLRKIQKRAEQKVEQRINQKIDKAIDKGLDEAEGKGKEKKEEKEAEGKPDSANEKKDLKEPASKEGKPASSPAAFSASSKFDFIPGEKTIVFEDFSQDALGDFPDKWNTDVSGEIMKIDGQEGKWFVITGEGSAIPEFITEIPNNATLEFDLVVSPEFYYYNSSLLVAIGQLADQKDFKNWNKYSSGKTEGIVLEFHPQDPSSSALARSAFTSYADSKELMRNNKNGISSFNNKNLNKVHVAIWRQNQRIRVYLGEEKIWDLPRALSANAALNSVVFSVGNISKQDQYYFISNIRLAVGSPDTRNKLLNEGKFTTTGINFNTGSAEIKPESHGVIKEIATVLQENPEVKIRITGHTDNTGDIDKNQVLSEKRAASVKEYLTAVFNIQASRIETSGKGQSEPVGNNNTSEGKAQNRRVEFIKL